MLIKIIIQNIKKHKILGLLTIITLSIAIVSINILNWIFLNIEKNLQISQFWTDQENKFIITPKDKNLFSLFSKNLASVYNELKKDPNIKEVYWIYLVKVPIWVNIKFWPIDFYTDALLYASDRWDLCFTGKYIELWLNPVAINIFNSQLNITPIAKITPQKLKNVKITLIFWKNSFLSFKKTEKKEGKITVLDNNFPLVGFTIGYKVAQETVNKIWGDIQLIKIIGYTKDLKYLLSLKNKYPNFNIITKYDILSNVEKKLTQVKFAINTVKIIIIILALSFFLILLINIKWKNSYIANVLKYNQAKKYQILLVTYWEIVIFIVIACFINFIAIMILNKHTKSIENYLKSRWYMVKVYPMK